MLYISTNIIVDSEYEKLTIFNKIRQSFKRFKKYISQTDRRNRI